MIFIYNPDLSETMKQTLQRFSNVCIPSLRLPHLPDGIATHPDLQIHPIDAKTVLCAPECFPYYQKVIPEHITVLSGITPLSGTYPGDCAYNAAGVGDFLFCNTSGVDAKLLELHRRRGKKIIHVNQGYTKCNLCPITDHLVFTEDLGIHNTIIDNNIPIKSILLPKGEIPINGYPHGFLGGSCGKGENSIFWYGNLNSCSYAREIRDIMDKEQIIEVPLSTEPLYDLGGIICLP